MPLLVALTIGLLAWSATSDLVLTPLTGDVGYVVGNLLATVLIVVAARRAGLDRHALGASRATLGPGVRWGAGAVALVALVLVLAVTAGDRLGPLALLLTDERASLGPGPLLFAVLVRIPVGTVLFEEVAFRGALDAAARRRLRPAAAYALSAGVFGLYHVPPTLVALRINEVAPTSAAGLGSLVGAVAVTAVAGLLFSWLRVRSGSLVAPMLAHTATNVGGLLAAVAFQGSA